MRVTTRAIVRGAAIGTMLLLLAQGASAQSGTTSGGTAHSGTVREDTVRNWYDTLEVERPRYARASLGERLALAAFTALALPVGLSVGATTIVPPTINALREGDETYYGIAVGTGFGYGGDTTQMTYWPDLRVQLDLGYYFGRDRPLVAHAAVLKDVLIASIHPKDLFWFGVSGGLGVATDIHSTEPYAEAWIGLLNPLGIRFAPLFPMHNYGLRGRVGYDSAASRMWYELSIGLTSTFGR